MNSAERPTKLLAADVTDKILAASFEVHNTLGCGFLEKVYENAMVVELARAGMRVEQQKLFQVKYEGAVVGDYVADLVAEGGVIVECKAVAAPDAVHDAQLLNYLRATGLKVGLLLNFAKPKVQFKRMVA